jgi:hypothetical protein
MIMDARRQSLLLAPERQRPCGSGTSTTTLLGHSTFTARMALPAPSRSFRLRAGIGSSCPLPAISCTPGHQPVVTQGRRSGAAQLGRTNWRRPREMANKVPVFWGLCPIGGPAVFHSGNPSPADAPDNRAPGAARPPQQGPAATVGDNLLIGRELGQPPFPT